MGYESWGSGAGPSLYRGEASQIEGRPSHYVGGSRRASTSTASPAVVRKAPVMICAARIWIRDTVAIMRCHAEQPYRTCGTTIALYACLVRFLELMMLELIGKQSLGSLGFDYFSMRVPAEPGIHRNAEVSA